MKTKGVVYPAERARTGGGQYYGVYIWHQRKHVCFLGPVKTDVRK